MKSRDIQRADLGVLVNAHRAAAATHGAALERGDHEQANRSHGEISAIYRELRKRGSAAQHALLPLLDDIDMHVRAWAAAHALEFAPEHAETVLDRLSERGGLAGINATMTLREWKKGSFVFP